MVTVSVPGKVHLMGEHAVVYGYPALLAAVNLRLSVTIAPGDSGVKIKSAESTDYIKHAIQIVQNYYQLSALPALALTVRSDIPSGYHLGSSAAVAVATIGALTYFLRNVWNPALINQLAYEAEKKQHGNPSGGDNTSVTFGGFLWYRKELEFLKSLWQMQFRLPVSLDHFFLLDTGKPKESTGDMVTAVRSKMKNDTATMQQLLNENEQQVRRIACAIKKENERELIDAIRKGEKTLESMGVVSKRAVSIIRAVEKTGGAAKILGGGGKTDGVGFLLAYHPDKSKIASFSRCYNIPFRKITLGEEGARLDRKN